MNVKKQQERLLKIIEDRFSGYGATIDDEQILHIGDQNTIALKPALALFEKVLSTDKFNRLTPLFDSEDNFLIADMYVELAVASTSGQTNPMRLTEGMSLSDELEANHQRQHARRVTIEQAVHTSTDRNIVILGDPGSGKTSLLKYLCLQIAKGESERWLIPVYIELRDYWQRKQHLPPGKTLSLLQYANTLVGNPSLLNEISGPEKEHVLFLLDGFDELASQQEAVDSLTIEIDQLQDGFSWVLTSRQTGFFGGLNENVRYQVISLHNQGIEDLVSNWFKQVEKDSAEENKRQVLIQIHNTPQLKRMARNPFLLTLLCYIRNINDKPLPLYRSAVYAEIVELIRSQLRFKKRDKKLFGKAEYDYLQYFCHYLYTGASQAPKQLFNHDDWDSCAEPGIAPALDKHFLDSRLLNGWRNDADYHFIHLTFQEYFIALHFAQRPFDEIKQHLYAPHWRMVFRFLAGIYWADGNKKSYTQLLKALIDPPDQAGLLYIEAAWMLVEAGLVDSSSMLGEDLRETLWQILLDDRPYVQVAAGEALAILAPDFICEKFYYMSPEELTGTDIRSSYSKAKPLSRTMVQLSSTIGQLPKKSNYLNTILLLGKTVSHNADVILLDLFWLEVDDDSNILVETINALGEKNTPELRHAVLESDHLRSAIYSQRVCRLATITRHQDFIPWLMAQLPKTPCPDLDAYRSVFIALKAIAAPDVESQLRTVIDNHSLSNMPFELLEAFAVINSNSVKTWFQQHLNDSETVRQRLLLIAIKYSFVDTDNILQILQDSEEQERLELIDAIGERAEMGGKTDRRITHFIAAIAFSEHCNDFLAMQVITSITHQEIKYNYATILQLANYRTVLNAHNHPKIKYALFILGKEKDALSFARIMEIANSDYPENVRISAIQALENFGDIHKDSLILCLKQIINAEKKQNGLLLESALEALAKIDFHACRDYLQLPIAKDIIAQASAEQSILLFKGYYIDRQGKQRYWMIELAPSKAAYEQLDALRKACQSLLDQGLAKYSGEYKGEKVPLFKKDGKGPAPIDIKTGMAFLEGKKITANTAERLMPWIIDAIKKTLG